MSQLDDALQRLDAAVTRLETALGERAASAGAGLADLEAERDQLSHEVLELRARADEDARLRTEAAAAVRDALHDLRGAIGQEAEEAAAQGIGEAGRNG